MISVRGSEELEQRLINLADKTGRSKAYYVRIALEKYLDENESLLLTLSDIEKQGKSPLTDAITDRSHR